MNTLGDIVIPYSRGPLQLALAGLDEERIDAQRADKIVEDSCFPQGRAELNRATAKDNGISLEVLINSPNYQQLCSNYSQGLVNLLVNALEEEFEITNEEAWAVVAKMLRSI